MSPSSSSILFLLATCSLWSVATSSSSQMMMSSMTSSEDEAAQNMVEVVRCFKSLQESGKRIYVTYIANQMRLFDVNGEEVSCDPLTQLQIRQRSDRRCMFSPIHCLFNKRIQTAKMLAKMHGNGGGGRLFAVRRRR